MLKELLISAAVIAGFASAVSAQTCATPPSCASLGYTLTAPKGGEGWVCTGCPFDPTKFACTAKPCPANSSTTQGATGSYSGSADISINYAVVHCTVGWNGDKPCRATARTWYGYWQGITSSEIIKTKAKNLDEAGVTACAGRYNP